MKCCNILVFVAGLASASIDLDDGTIPQRARFEAWIKEHEMAFQGVELMKAWFAWVDNDKIIQEVNAKGFSYKLGHNRFSHMTSEEFASTYARGLSKSHLHTNNETVDWTLADPVRQKSAPSSVDWVAQGAVTEPKSQGVCASCWAFSTTGAVESAYKIAGYPLTAFSEEQLVECDQNNNGCQPGHYREAFKYVQLHGLCTENDYPYGANTRNRGVVGNCRYRCTHVVRISGWSNVPEFNENALKVAVAQQPVNVAVDGEDSHWQFYHSGIMDNTGCSQNVDHAVLAVGYGTDQGEDYWYVKNSWGGDWGEGGYIRLKRDENTCGISRCPSFPTGAAPINPPSPSPTPSPAHHYGDPSTGCLSDENVFALTGIIPGNICSPPCGDHHVCSQDFQSDMMHPAALCETWTNQCILTCSSTSECGQATCHGIPGYPIGLCTYGDSVDGSSFNQSKSVILK